MIQPMCVEEKKQGQLQFQLQFVTNNKEKHGGGGPKPEIIKMVTYHRSGERTKVGSRDRKTKKKSNYTF